MTGNKTLSVDDELHEMAKKAVSNVSSCKPDIGIAFLCDNNIDTYWQSDGACPTSSKSRSFISCSRSSSEGILDGSRHKYAGYVYGLQAQRDSNGFHYLKILGVLLWRLEWCWSSHKLQVMRVEGGYEIITKATEKLGKGKRHKENIAAYGEG